MFHIFKVIIYNSSLHLHLSVAYLLEADESGELIVKKDENSGVKWIPINEVRNYSTEPDMIVLYKKFNEKINIGTSTLGKPRYMGFHTKFSFCYARLH